jgi:hypothetical protein
VRFENAVIVNAGQTVEGEFEIAAPASASVVAGVNHFRLISKVGAEKDVFEETFITPSKDSP